MTRETGMSGMLFRRLILMSNSSQVLRGKIEWKGPSIIRRTLMSTGDPLERRTSTLKNAETHGHSNMGLRILCRYTVARREWSIDRPLIRRPPISTIHSSCRTLSTFSRSISTPAKRWCWMQQEPRSNRSFRLLAKRCCSSRETLTNRLGTRWITVRFQGTLNLSVLSILLSRRSQTLGYRADWPLRGQPYRRTTPNTSWRRAMLMRTIQNRKRSRNMSNNESIRV